MLEKKRGLFTHAASGVASAVSTSYAFLAAAALVLGWACAGPFFGFSERWQLFIHTSTSIITFLMVFIIQNTQTRDVRAIHIKLDELIRVNEGAHEELMDLEEMDEAHLTERKDEFADLAEDARARGDHGRAPKERD